jgi:HK97 family phage major capsid protein
VLATGTGGGQPEGLFTNGRARADCVAGGAATGFTTTAMLRLYWGLPAQYRKNGKFLMNSATALFLAQMTDNNGRFMWQMNDAFGGGLGSPQQDGSVVMQPKLLNMPLVISEQAPANTTNNFPVAFGDFRGYIKAERIGMTVRVLDEIYAETDQKLYLMRYRVGGQLAEDYRIKLLRDQV